VTAGVLATVVAAMVGLSFASVPLYRMFCQVTGFAGTPRTENVDRASATSDTLVTVRFDANVNSELPWQFAPVERQRAVRPGEEVLIHYRAVNVSDHPVSGTATFNVTPFKAAPYFAKLECFCFTEQTLQPGEEVMMPVLFYVDPGLLANPDTKDVRTVTLSYTFFRASDDGTAAPGKGVAAAADGASKG
jgi:cytochrome c oxidase assembly protein subunit 11